jgi:hypothetical protein
VACLALLSACTQGSHGVRVQGHAAPPARPVVARAAQAPEGDVVARSARGGSVVATAVEVPPAGPGQGAVTVVVFDPAATRLVLHAGSQSPVRGGSWVHGAVIGAAERRRVVAAFNGGFKTGSSRGGWMSEGRTVVPLVRGAASVVVYRDGGTDVGAWGSEVPAPGRAVASVRQNLQLLVDGGRPRLTAPLVLRRLEDVWGHTFKHERLVARSALGVTARGGLVYAAGSRITVAALAQALLAQGVVRAMELDINAPMVRGFLFAGAADVRTRGGATPAALPLVVGQTQGPGYPSGGPVPHCTYVLPCPRDFFTVVLR